MIAENKDLRKLQGLFLRPRKEARTAAVENQLKSNNVFNQSGKSPQGWSRNLKRSLDTPSSADRGKDVDTLGVHIDDNLINSTHNR